MIACRPRGLIPSLCCSCQLKGNICFTPEVVSVINFVHFRNILNVSAFTTWSAPILFENREIKKGLLPLFTLKNHHQVYISSKQPGSCPCFPLPFPGNGRPPSGPGIFHSWLTSFENCSGVRTFLA